jgi:hypothetical protein
MPLCRSSGERILREKDLEEVLKQSRFSVWFRQHGRAEIGLWQAALVTDCDHGFANSRIETSQRRSTTACAWRLVRTLL